jgi:transposase
MLHLTLRIGGAGRHNHRLTTAYANHGADSAHPNSPTTSQMVTFNRNGWSFWTETRGHVAPTLPVTFAEIHTYNGETLIEFLTDLHELEPGRRMVLLWDGLPAHRSRCMTGWIDDQGAWLSVERLPGYTPELNPTEQVFGNLKSTDLANLCRSTIVEVQAIAENGLHRIGSDAQLCFAFLRHSGLQL